MKMLMMIEADSNANIIFSFIISLFISYIILQRLKSIIGIEKRKGEIGSPANVEETTY